MKKILFISNISDKITNFAIPSIEAGQKLGYEVHLAANYSNFSDNADNYNVKINHIDIIRNPFSIGNIKALIQMCKLIKKEKYDVIHCNTPIGGILGRISGKICGVSKVIYTAHGFHFYKGAPLINNIIYKNIEKWLAKITDSIITITKEDYISALKFKMSNNNLNVFYVPGVGIDRKNIINKTYNRDELCRNLGINEEDFIIVSAGELNRNKNQKVIIEAIANIPDNIKIQYIICGVGPLEEELKSLAKEKGIYKNVHFLGFRNDIISIIKSSDLFVMSSYREGLSRAIMEAMTCGKPVIASKIRGNVDLINNNECLFESNDYIALANIIQEFFKDKSKCINIGMQFFEDAKQYDIKMIKKNMLEIYKEILLYSE
ncbi:glycosyltransferase family 4 protein [Clostridium perfringens]